MVAGDVERLNCVRFFEFQLQRQELLEGATGDLDFDLKVEKKNISKM
jgi:hypothetical protein